MTSAKTIKTKAILIKAQVPGKIKGELCVIILDKGGSADSWEGLEFEIIEPPTDEDAVNEAYLHLESEASESNTKQECVMFRQGFLQCYKWTLKRLGL